MQETHYAILNLTPKADLTDIRKAYRKLARQYHPDVNGGSAHAEEQFKKIAVAYDILSDPGKRLVYDMQLLDEIVSNQNTLRREYRSQTHRRRHHHSYHKQRTTHSTAQFYSRFVVWGLVLGVMMLAFTMFYAFSKYQKQALYEKAVTIREQKEDPRKALRYLMNGNDLPFGSSAAHYLLAAEISLNDIGDYGRAGKYAIRGLNANPDQQQRSALLYIKGKFEMYKGQPRESYRTFEYAYNHGSGPDSALYAMAEIKTLVEQDYLSGIRLANQLIDSAPTFSHAWFLKAYGNYKLNRFEEAEQMIQRFLSEQPGSGIGYFLQARISMALGEQGLSVCELLRKATLAGYPVGDDILSQYCGE
ncbi:MAG: DnaJ domain-containing protein [Cyclobacteriaceae bacterium]